LLLLLTGCVSFSASDRDDDYPNLASLRPGSGFGSSSRRAESKSDSIDFDRLPVLDAKADYSPVKKVPEKLESKSDFRSAPPVLETKKAYSGAPPVLEKKAFAGPPPKLVKDRAVDLESSARTEDSLAFTNDSLGYSDTLVYSPHSGMVPNSMGSRATRYSNESNRHGGSGGRYGGSGGLDESSDFDRSVDQVEELEDESYIRRPAAESSSRPKTAGASGRDRDAVERTMLSSIGRDEEDEDRMSDDEGDHIRYLRDVGDLSADRGQGGGGDSIDLSQTAESDGIYAFNDDSRDAVGHADIYGHRNNNSSGGVAETRSRGRLPSDSFLTTPDKSPASRKKYEQRTYSNLSKADSLFRGLPAGGEEGDGSDGEHSLVLSESNNFSDDDDYRR
jgi:hypothetical protein